MMLAEVGKARMRTESAQQMLDAVNLWIVEIEPINAASCN